MQTTVDIPEPLHEAMREQAERLGKPMDELIVQAVEQAYEHLLPKKKGRRLMGPIITDPGPRGPRYPTDRVDDDLIFP